MSYVYKDSGRPPAIWPQSPGSSRFTAREHAAPSRAGGCCEDVRDALKNWSRLRLPAARRTALKAARPPYGPSPEPEPAGEGAVKAFWATKSVRR